MTNRHFTFIVALCAAFSLASFAQTIPSGGTAGKTPKTTTPHSSTNMSNLVVVIPLNGVVGPTLDDDQWFSAADFKKALEKAEKLDPAAVILEIKSPGGLVSTEELIIQTILDSEARGTRIVAWVTDAGSAAALITLACKEIFIKPSARVGAAVTIVSGSTGTSSLKSLTKDDPELAAKYESFHSAIHKAAAEATGRSPAIAAAMCDMSKELWWSKDGGFSDQQRTPTDERIDGPKEVLTLTAGTMEKTGIAKQENSLDDMIKSLALRRTAEIKRLDSEMTSNPKKLVRLRAKADEYRHQARDSKPDSDNQKHVEAELAKIILQANKLLEER